MPLDNTDWAADQYLPKIPTEALREELGKRETYKAIQFSKVVMIDHMHHILERYKKGELSEKETLIKLMEQFERLHEVSK